MCVEVVSTVTGDPERDVREMVRDIPDRYTTSRRGRVPLQSDIRRAGLV